jgi:hypothetical protein
VAVLEFRALNADPALAALLSEVALTEASSQPGFAVIGKSDIAALLGFEKQKALLGCAEDYACLADIGGALGVKLILVGSVGKVGALHRLDVKLVETGKGAAQRVGVNVEGPDEKLVGAVQAAVRSLFGEVTATTTAAVAAAPAAQAPPDRWRRVALGAHLAYGAPGGKFAEGVKQDQYVNGQWLAQLDAGYEVVRDLTVGLYASAGVGFTGKLFDPFCGPGQKTCKTRVKRFGLDVTWAFPEVSPIVIPWVNGGIGLEFLSVVGEDDLGDRFEVDVSGLEPFHLGLGLDFRLGPVRLGPYATFGIASYDRKGKVDLAILSLTPPPLGGGTHTWLLMGVRGTLGL